MEEPTRIKSVRLTKPVYLEVSEKAKAENRTFTNMLQTLIIRGLKS